ncbi:MAG: DeoR/GlpR family DNA-binding transcription regulator [Spirochaetes bacterium]|nr:DeoR/GlpR family DNA-binding transcription regulator [Spirochaetota bacterium]
MLAVERRKKIFGLLRQQGIVTVSDLSQQFEVSEETIRRDLQKMESSDGVARTYGGAYITKAVHSDIPIRIREGIYIEGKETIASLCEAMITDGETVILDSSTTSLHIADRLKSRRNLVVITNAVKIAIALAESDGVKVICTGGTLRGSQLSFVGPAASKSLGAYYADKAFVSCTGIDLANGITDSDEQEAEIRKRMLEQAQRTILVADNTKLGKTSFSLIATLDAMDALVTDKDPGPEWLSEMDRLKIKVSYR